MANTWINRAAVPVIAVYRTDAAGMTERFGAGVDFHTYANNAEWLYDPDLSAVLGQPTKYWVITGDVISLLGQSARDAIDDAEVIAQLDGIADEIDQAQTYSKAAMEVIIDEFNKHSLRLNAVLDAIDGANNLAGVKSAIAAISDLNPRALSQLKTALRGKL